jgi:hypothetical protein
VTKAQVEHAQGDRAARDDLIEAVLAYMRREIDNRGLEKRLEPYLGTRRRGKTIALAAELIWCHYDDFRTHFVHPWPGEWDSLRRILAFLKTDRDLTRQRIGVRHWRRWVALAGLALLAAGAAAAWEYRTFEYLAGMWVVVGAAWVLIWPYPAPTAEVGERARYSPFRDRADWEAHRPLLRDMGVPPYTSHADDRLDRPAWNALWQDLDWRLLSLLGLPLVLLAALRNPSWRLILAEKVPEASEHGPDQGDAAEMQE